MRADTYEVLVSQIAAVMAASGKDQARTLAAELVVLVNASLAGSPTPVPSPAAAQLLPPALRTAGALTAPWVAFQQVHESESSMQGQSTPPELLCTLPQAFRQDEIARRLAREGGLRAGTLMTRLYEVINAAEETLYLVCPYWSEMGILGLMRHVTRERMDGLKVVVLTRPREALDTDNLRGVIALTEELRQRGADIVVKSPLRGKDGKAPLVHAKVIVRDGVQAYLGSANFSLSGMESSFEVGVLLTGPQASGLQAWAEALEAGFEDWKA